MLRALELIDQTLVEPGIPAGRVPGRDLESCTGHFLLGVVDERPEEPPFRVGVSTPIEVLLVVEDEFLEGGSDAVPPGGVVAHLRPGEDPGDCTEVLERHRPSGP